MRCAGPHVRWPLLSATFALALAGCGRSGGSGSQTLTLEALPDTAGLSRGGPIIEAIEPYRMPNGAVRVRGRAHLPDGTRLYVIVRRPGSRVSAAMTRVDVRDGTFDSPPLVGESGPLPAAPYAFDVRADFTREAQPEGVMRVTRGGAALRGPGVTRRRDGAPALFVTREARP